MPPITFCNTDDFKDSNGNLAINIPKFALALFWSSNCKYCESAKHILSNMNQQINGCSFAMCNLDTNREMIQLCNNAGIALEHVPFFVFFANKSPYMIYAGPIAQDQLTRFVIEVSTQYHKENAKKTNTTTSIKDIGENTQVADSCNVGDIACQEKAKSTFNSSYCTLKEAYANNRK